MPRQLSKALRGLKHRGIQVILIVTLYLLTAKGLPLPVHQALYTLSLLIKDLLVWVLPVTVGLFIAHTVSSFHSKAPLFVLTLVLFEALSNLVSVWYAFSGGHIAADFLPSMALPGKTIDFDALWRFPFTKPQWWSADKGTLFGVFLGFLGAFGKTPGLNRTIEQGRKGAQWILTHIFSRMIPLFVLGFVARMVHTQLLSRTFVHYGALLLWLILFLALYLSLLFFLSSNGTLRGFLQGGKNLLPAGALAFASGCSLSTMPWTIAGSAKNLQDPELAKAVIPATTNIQQIGDCIANTFLCFIIYKNFFGHSPDLMTWASFSAIFVLARFATAAILGGAIFIMLPIYESYLGFNAEMIALILAFNVILDPIITSCNVLANGALCRVFEKVWALLLRKREPSAPTISD